jgi:hypothetical protein
MNKFLAKFLLLLCLIPGEVAPRLAFGDTYSNIKRDGFKFPSVSHTAQATLMNRGTQYSVKANGKHLYDSSPSIARLDLGDAYLSDDGQTLIWILANRFFGETSEEALQSPALIFFQAGEAVKQYTLAELLVRPKLISSSTSHTQWILEPMNANWRFLAPVRFTPHENRLQFETTSFRQYVFDTKTGNMLSGGDTDLWKQSEVILYGELVSSGSDWNIKLGKFIKGNIENLQSSIIHDPTGTYSAGWHTLALRKLGDKWVVLTPTFELSVLYNTL